MSAGPPAWTLLPALLLTLPSCGAARTGLDGGAGISTTGHALEGTWGQRVVIASLVPVPFLGEQKSGGIATRLVHRTWDEGTGRFHERFERCSHEFLPLANAQTTVDPATLPKLAAVEYDATLDTDAGVYATEAIVDLWGVHGLPSPTETPLPTGSDYQSEPQASWLSDDDGDGHPGITLHVTGLFTGATYGCRRTVSTLQGQVVSPERVQGLVTVSALNANVVDSTVNALRGTSNGRQDPDPGLSWFDELRLADGATCDDVLAAASDGRLPATRPF